MYTQVCDYYSKKTTSEVFFIEFISESLTHIQSDNAKAWHFLLNQIFENVLRISGIVFHILKKIKALLIS